METDSMMAIKTRFEQMVSWRRYLHQHPELSFQESDTAKWIVAQLQQMGYTPQQHVGGHGVVATIKGRHAGPTVALRADIDALPIQDEKQCSYKSKVDGIMHACGHDAHTATLLAIADYYISLNGEFSGERRFIFQPAEEVSPGGAVGMIAAGVLEGVDVIYGVHLWTPIPYGHVSSKSGPFMAATDEFEFDIVGRGGHCGLPHETIDTIVVGSAIVQAMQAIVSRNVNPLDSVVVSIGYMQAGTTSNVIAERCTLRGTVRTYNERVRQNVLERVKHIVNQTASAYGATVEMDIRSGYPAVVNSHREYERFTKVVEQQFGAEQLIPSSGIMAGEDFAYYLQEVPGCFLFVGAGNDEIGAIYPHHHPKFDLDERSMIMSAQLMIAMAEHYCQE